MQKRKDQQKSGSDKKGATPPFTSIAKTYKRLHGVFDFYKM
ncbi:hypothetical protein [Pontibacter kalidii]|nr:hypothetical protein [Pontibacter kalidii]